MSGLKPFRVVPENIREWTRWMKAQDIPEATTDGTSTYLANIYQRSATTPTTPDGNTGSYNFTTTTLTPPEGWFASAPATDGNPLYISSGTFEIVGATGTDTTTSWSDPVIVAQDGATGGTGTDASTVSLAATSYTFSYDNSTGTPSIIGPSSITFTVNRQNISGSTTWAMEDSAAGDETAKLTSTSDTSATLTETNFAAITLNSVVKVTATADAISDTISIVELLSGQFGNTSYFASVYLRKGSSPTEPINDDGSYNFSTKTLTAPSTGGGSADDWFVAPPATDGNPLYVSNGIFEINGITATDSTVDWTAPVQLVDDGATGGDGNSVFVGNVFLRKASSPTEPINDDGSYNFTTNVLDPPTISGGSADNWSITVPAGSDDLYVSSGTFEINGATGTDSTVDWTAPVILASDGATGASGTVIHVGSAYLRKGSSPTEPINDDGSYNFATLTLTPPSTGGGSADNWSITVPAGSDPLYVSNATFEAAIGGTDSTCDWSAPVILASDGATGGAGTDGTVIFHGSVYLRKGSSPTEPINDDGSYNFATLTLTPPSTGGGSADNWSITVPAGSDPLYVSNGVFEAAIGGTDSTVDWTAPTILASDGATGATGGDGNSVFVGNVFLRKSSSPTEPINDDGSYNFTTNVLDPPSTVGGSADNWSITVPAGSDDLYVSSGAFEINGATGTDTTVDWTAPVIMASDGATGSTGGDGDSVYYASAFQRAAAPPSTPSADDGSYNFTSSTLTPPTGWSTTPPATDGNPLYVTNGVFSINGTTGTDTTVTWTAPAVLASDGAEAVAHYLTNEAHVVAADNDGTNYSLTGAGGTHKLFEGLTDQTTTATHSVVGGSGSPHVLAQNGLTMSIVVATGVYTLSGASWTTDQETFTLRANYESDDYDKVYTIAKSKAGGTGAAQRVTMYGASIGHVAIDPADAQVGYRVDSDGDIYTAAGDVTATFSSVGTWLNTGSNADYECRITLINGDDPTSGSALETWLACTSDRTWLWTETVLSGIGLVGLHRIEIRDDTTLEILGSAEIDSQADVDT